MYKTRSEKLTALQDYMNLETGRIKESSFIWENTLYEKALRKKLLDSRILRCTKCPGLNIARFTEACPGWGNLNADVFFIGQSLHKPGVRSGLPFIGGSGYMIDAALRLSGLLRHEVYFWNTVLCHPANNRASTSEEKENCFPYLREVISIVQPKMIIALGNDAKEAVGKLSGWSEDPPRTLCIRHPASFSYSEPESRYLWIVKLSLEIDKVLK